MINRPDVHISDRTRVTAKLIKDLAPRSVLELGAGDYSFDEVFGDNRPVWVKADYAPPADILCDFNQREVTLPLQTGSFDLIICTEVLEHLLWPDAVLKEANRLLAPGGKILVSVPNAVSLPYRVAWMLGHVPSCAAAGNIPTSPTAYDSQDGFKIGGHVIDFSLSRLTTLFQGSGFAPCAVKGSGLIRRKQILPHWLVPAAWSSNLIMVAAKASAAR